MLTELLLRGEQDHVFVYCRAPTVISMKTIKAMIIIGIWLALGAIPQRAVSHHPLDPDGKPVTWYPHECCHDHDCQPVASVREITGRPLDDTG